LLAQRLGSAIHQQHLQRLNALDKIAAALAHLNPESTLARGFSIIRDASGNLVTDASSLHAGQTVRFDLARGSAEAAILTSSPDQGPVAT
jgi:exodeoxyribonuclease VII large subunit